MTQRKPIQVRPFPLARSFPSIEAAVAHAMSYPRLPEARRDAARLKGSLFIDAYWTPYEWMIRFDCALSLHVWIEASEVRWSVRPTAEVVAGPEFQGVGAEPVTLDWGGTVGPWDMDCSMLVAKRRGARFKDLFISEHGLFIYLHGHLILQLGRVQRIADGQPIVYAFEDD